MNLEPKTAVLGGVLWMFCVEAILHRLQAKQVPRWDEKALNTSKTGPWGSKERRNTRRTQKNLKDAESLTPPELFIFEYI